MIDDQKKLEIAEFALGTCRSSGELAETFSVEEQDVLQALIDNEMEWCDSCGWVVEVSEMNEDNFCQDCQADNNFEDGGD